MTLYCPLRQLCILAASPATSDLCLITQLVINTRPNLSQIYYITDSTNITGCTEHYKKSHHRICITAIWKRLVSVTLTAQVVSDIGGISPMVLWCHCSLRPVCFCAGLAEWSSTKYEYVWSCNIGHCIYRDLTSENVSTDIALLWSVPYTKLRQMICDCFNNSLAYFGMLFILEPADTTCSAAHPWNE